MLNMCDLFDDDYKVCSWRVNCGQAVMTSTLTVGRPNAEVRGLEFIDKVCRCRFMEAFVSQNGDLILNP